MRITLTHPSCWPEVRRGAERFLAELSQYLARRQYDVTVLSGHSHATRIENTDSGRRVLVRQPWHPALASLRLTSIHWFFLTTMRRIRSLRPDLVHSFHYLDAYAASLRGLGQYKVVYYVTGPPVPAYLRRIPPDRYVLRQAIRNADLLLAPSQTVAGLISEHHGRDSLVLPVPIDITAFKPQPRQRDRIIVLAVGAFDDRRKGARPLVDAFLRFKQHHRGALLQLSGQISPELRRELLDRIPESDRSAVEFLGPGTLDELPRLYGEATLTAIPAKWEAYSLVMLESWACGTPVVAARHGALPELLADPRCGVLFEPGPEGVEVSDIESLTEALNEGVKLAERPETAQICRERAEAYDWQRLGPLYERAYRDLLK